MKKTWPWLCVGLGTMALFACSDSGDDTAQTAEQPDSGGPSDEPVGDDDARPLSELPQDELDEVESQTLEVLQGEEFQEAACKLAAINGAGMQAGLSCEEVIDDCLQAVAELDAATLESSLPIPSDFEALADCDATAAELDACIAQLVTVVVDTSEDLECGVDAGLPEFGPEALASAPACLIVLLKCPDLLDLSMMGG